VILERAFWGITRGALPPAWTRRRIARNPCVRATASLGSSVRRRKG